MAAGFKYATVNASDVPATQTNFPAYVDLSRLGITTLAEAQSVRVYAESSKTTEWAREIVSATEMHVKVPSLTSTVEIYVDWDGVRADYAVGDTYGRNAVWSDYAAVYHMDSLTTDYSGNSKTLTNTNSVANATGKIGQAADFGTSNTTKVLERTADDVLAYTQFASEWTMTGWFKLASTSTTGAVFWCRSTNGSQLRQVGAQIDTGNLLTSQPFPNATTVSTSYTRVTTWEKVSISWTPSTFRQLVNGSQIASASHTWGTFTTNSRYFGIGAYFSGTYLSGLIDEVRIAKKYWGADWETTEYNNQSDEAGFWGTWTDAGGGGSPTPTLMMMGVGT